MRNEQTGTPASLPVTLQEVKDWVKVEDENSNARLVALMRSATEIAENYCQRPIIQREFKAYMNGFPECIELLSVPVQSVDSISYIDTDGASQTLATSVYQVDLGDKYRKARIERAYSQSWPSVRDQMNSVTVTYTAGYGEDWNSVPECVKSGILYLVGEWFDHRRALSEMSNMPEPVKILFEAERVRSL